MRGSGSGSSGIYHPEEWQYIQDPIENGDRVAGSMEIDGDVVRSMMKQLGLSMFWYFSMVGVIYIVDLNHYLLIFIQFLVFCVRQHDNSGVSSLIFVFLFVTLSFSRSRVFVFIFIFLEISPHGHRPSVATRPPLLLWSSQYWVGNGIHPLSRCVSRGSSGCLS